jgi:hypothetical protein
MSTSASGGATPPPRARIGGGGERRREGKWRLAWTGRKKGAQKGSSGDKARLPRIAPARGRPAALTGNAAARGGRATSARIQSARAASTHLARVHVSAQSRHHHHHAARGGGRGSRSKETTRLGRGRRAVRPRQGSSPRAARQDERPCPLARGHCLHSCEGAGGRGGEPRLRVCALSSFRGRAGCVCVTLCVFSRAGVFSRYYMSGVVGKACGARGDGGAKMFRLERGRGEGVGRKASLVSSLALLSLSPCSSLPLFGTRRDGAHNNNTQRTSTTTDPLVTKTLDSSLPRPWTSLRQTERA